MMFSVPEPPLLIAPPVAVAWLSANDELMMLSVPLLEFAIAPPDATIVPPKLSVKMLSTTFTIPLPSCETPPPALIPVGRPFTTLKPDRVTSADDVTRKIRKLSALLRRTVVRSIPGLMMRMLVLRSGSALVKLILQCGPVGSQLGSVVGMLIVISSSPASAFAR